MPYDNDPTATYPRPRSTAGKRFEIATKQALGRRQRRPDTDATPVEATQPTKWLIGTSDGREWLTVEYPGAEISTVLAVRAHDGKKNYAVHTNQIVWWRNAGA